MLAIHGSILIKQPNNKVASKLCLKRTKFNVDVNPGKNLSISYEYKTNPKDIKIKYPKS